MKKQTNPIVELILCIFLGFLGIHRFYAGKKKSGLVYLFTLGLCGLGWIFDIIVLLVKYFSSMRDAHIERSAADDALNIQIKNLQQEHSAAVSSPNLTPESINGKLRSYHYKDVDIWVKWQYCGRYGESCESIGMKRGDTLQLKPPSAADEDPKSIAIYWKGNEIGYMKTNRMRDMVHQWNAAELPVLAIVSHVGGDSKVLVEFAFYSKP